MPFLSKPVKYKAKKFVFSCTSGQMMSNVGFTETFNCKSEHESHLVHSWIDQNIYSRMG